MNKLSVKKIVLNSINECGCQDSGQESGQEKPFYLAPDIIGSINKAHLDKKENIFHTDFNTTDGRNLKFKTKADSFFKWVGDNEIGGKEEDMIKKFLSDFLTNAKEVGSENLEEIVDDMGNLIGNDDLPNNSNNSMIGTAHMDTDKAIHQTVPKSRRFYGTYGLGYISW